MPRTTASSVSAVRTIGDSHRSSPMRASLRERHTYAAGFTYPRVVVADRIAIGEPQSAPPASMFMFQLWGLHLFFASAGVEIPAAK